MVATLTNLWTIRIPNELRIWASLYLIFLNLPSLDFLVLHIFFFKITHFLKWQLCHFPVMVICFVDVNLPTVFLMFFNKLASCPVTYINLNLFLNIPLKAAISCNVIIACSFTVASIVLHFFLFFLTVAHLFLHFPHFNLKFLTYLFG